MVAPYLYTPGCCCGADAGEEAYVAAAWGTTIVCFDADDGSVRWTYDLQTLDGSVTWTPGNLVFDADGNLYADWVRSDERWGLLSLGLDGTYRWHLDYSATPFLVQGSLYGYAYLSHLRWRGGKLYAAPPGLASKAVLLRLDAAGTLEFTLTSTNSGSVSPALRDFDVDLGGKLWLIPWGTLRFGADFLGDAQLSRLSAAGSVEWKNSQPITEASTPYSGTALIPFALAVRCSDTSADIVHVGLATDSLLYGSGNYVDCSSAAWTKHPDFVVELGAAQTSPLVYGAGCDYCDLATFVGLPVYYHRSTGAAGDLDLLDGVLLASPATALYFGAGGAPSPGGHPGLPPAAQITLWSMHVGSLAPVMAYRTTAANTEPVGYVGHSTGTIRWLAGTNRRLVTVRTNIAAVGATPKPTLHCLDTTGTILWRGLYNAASNIVFTPFRRGLATFVAE